MTYPTFNNGDPLPASDLNAIGLWLVKSQTVGAGVSTVNVTNAFSADYDNYLITYTGGTLASNANLSLRLGATTTGYYGVLMYSTPVSGTYNGIGVNNGANFTYAGGGGSNGARISINVYTPFLTTRTGVFAPYVETGAGSQAYGFFSGNLDNATSFTDFTIGTNGGALTGGTIRVYGYRN